MDIGRILIAFGLTLIAGLSTGIGSIIAFFAKRTNTRFLSISLGFSAGVMIYVSFADMYVEAQSTLAIALGQRNGAWAAALAFFGGMLLIALIDKLIPSAENPHEIKRVEDVGDVEDGNIPNDSTKLIRMGTLTALAIAIHNFPEGIATFIAAMKDPSLGIAITVAVAIHNIPEGISVSIPIYYATGDKKKAFKLSFLSGLAEPLGALVGFLILMPFLNDVVFGVVFAVVAGIMVYIALDELLPAAREYEQAHLSIYGLIAGMMVMAVSLILFM
ncbi:MAG TPA: zinc transporter ZupT [Thermoclostridium sp.]|nr:zinc transporter ZupT [Thermoclostridium sp.]